MEFPKQIFGHSYIAQISVSGCAVLHPVASGQVTLASWVRWGETVGGLHIKKKYFYKVPAKKSGGQIENVVDVRILPEIIFLSAYDVFFRDSEASHAENCLLRSVDSNQN